MDRVEADLIARRTINAYRAAVDAKDRDAMAAVFSSDAVLRRHDPLVGREAVLGFYQGFFESVGQMRHYIVNTIAEPEGDLIRAESHFSFLHVLDEGVRFGWGDYTDMIRPIGDFDGEIVDKTITLHAMQVVPMDVAAALRPGGR